MFSLPGLPVTGSGYAFPQTSRRHFRSRERLRGVKQAATRLLRKDAEVNPTPNRREAFEKMRAFPLAAFVLQIEQAAGIVRLPRYKPEPLPVAPVMKASEVMPEPKKTYRQMNRDAERAAHARVISAKTEEERLTALLAWQALTRLGGNEIARIVAPKIGAFVQAVMRDPVADRIAARVAKANAAAGVGKGVAR